jgi:hypothetical protein
LPENITLLNTDPKALQLLYNKLAGYESSIKGYNFYLRWAEAHVENLIKQIHEIYIDFKKKRQYSNSRGMPASWRESWGIGAL